jgi:hypothetical protein
MRCLAEVSIAWQLRRWARVRPSVVNFQRRVRTKGADRTMHGDLTLKLKIAFVPDEHNRDIVCICFLKKA